MSDAGYVRLHRSLIGHAEFRNDAEAMAFAWMIARASWRPARVRYKGIPITLARGQLAVSVRDFAAAMDRPKGWVERLFARLQNGTMIRTHSETGVTIITICNYDVYQASDDEGRTANGTSDETRAGQRQDTEQGREEGKKEISKDILPPTRAKALRGSRLPADFAPVLTRDPQRIVDTWPPGMLERELAQFRDHHTARGTTMKDWQAAFRTWITNADKWRQRNNGSRNGQSRSGAGRVVDGALDWIANG